MTCSLAPPHCPTRPTGADRGTSPPRWPSPAPRSPGGTAGRARGRCPRNRAVACRPHQPRPGETGVPLRQRPRREMVRAHHRVKPAASACNRIVQEPPDAPAHERRGSRGSSRRPFTQRGGRSITVRAPRSGFRTPARRRAACAGVSRPSCRPSPTRSSNRAGSLRRRPTSTRSSRAGHLLLPHAQSVASRRCPDKLPAHLGAGSAAPAPAPCYRRRGPPARPDTVHRRCRSPRR